jgi:actin related protein 2/3 complex subunit 2
MILLELANRILEETLLDRFNATKHVTIDMTCADFDGVQFHIWSNKDKKSEVYISVSVKNAAGFKQYGADNKIKSVYGPYVTTPENGYDWTLKVDAEALGGQNKAELAKRIALIKRHIFAAPFEYVLDAIDKGQTPPMVDLQYRGTNERIWIKAEGKERCTVVFSIQFKDPDDIVIGKTFLQEFQKSISGAPSVAFTQKDPPGELRGVKGVSPDQSMAYVVFVLFDRHFAKEKRAKTIDTLQTFRNYLHYHIKCSKSHLHTRMRNRVESLLKILNRAKQDLPVEKKTITGRTFVRKDAKK